MPARLGVRASSEAAAPAGDLSVVSSGLVAAKDAHEGVSAACGANSFTPDTSVVMGDGSTKPLDQVKVGDKVEATNTKTGKTTAQTVTKVWINHDTDLMDVAIKVGAKTSVVHTTQHHPFWDVTRKAWIEADQVAAGDQLRTDNGSIATVAGTVVVPGAADMWDLTVQTSHDFYIDTTAANILVHNCSLPGVGDTPTKVVNSNLGHVDLERAQRAGFTTVRGAGDAVRSLGKSIETDGFPEGTIADTAHDDRLLVPIGTNGYAVYQIGSNGNAVFKTILNAR